MPGLFASHQGRRTLPGASLAPLAAGSRVHFPALRCPQTPRQVGAPSHLPAPWDHLVLLLCASEVALSKQPCVVPLPPAGGPGPWMGSGPSAPLSLPLGLPPIPPPGGREGRWPPAKLCSPPTVASTCGRAKRLRGSQLSA